MVGAHAAGQDDEAILSAMARPLSSEMGRSKLRVAAGSMTDAPTLIEFIKVIGYFTSINEW